VIEPNFVDYSGAAPILLPVSILRYWRGFYLPADPDDDDDLPDLEIAEGAFNICDDFDFENPKTDYDRACSLGGIPAVQMISVGPGKGLVFATELDPLSWWPRMQTLVNGGGLPEPARLEKVEWSDELVWQNDDAEFILMNACDHGCAPRKNDSFNVHLPSGEYVVQRGEYGWAGNDLALVLFRFVLQIGG
jgi:hypothetical protein